MTICFFDFDGTITSRDSMFDFIRHAKGDVVFLAGFLLLLPVLILYKLGGIANYRAKEMVVTLFFKGMDRSKFLARASRYSVTRMPRIIRPKALERIRWHQEQGHRVVIVSASVDEWLRPWCKKNNIELLATRLAYKKGRVTGQISGQNCYGHEKEIRIRQAYDLSSWSCIYAYGDSRGDHEMLALAHKGYYRPFEND